MKTMTADEAISKIQSQAERIRNDETQRFPDAATPGDSHRQGDLYITLLGSVPVGAKAIPFRAQLADGTTQGSRHCLASETGVTMFERSEPSNLDGPVFTLECENTITHPEHGNVVLPPGIYCITYQRDLDAEERERRVID